MNIKRSKDLIAGQAEKFSIPEQQLQLIVNAYWRTVTDALAELIHIRVKVQGIGTYRAMHRVVQELLAEKQKALKGLRKGTNLRKETEEDIFRLKIMRDMRESEIVYEKDFRKKKKIDKNLVKGSRYEPKREITKGMGEQGTDS